jgi:hypothetical protein
VGPGGLEPPTLRLSGVRSNHLSYEPFSQSLNQKTPGSGKPPQVRHLKNPLNNTFSHIAGGAYRDRTDDLKLAKLALSQLS